MDFSTEGVIALIERHREWAFFIAMALAAIETIAFFSIFVPSTAMLVGVGAVVATGAMPFFPVWAGASIGAVLGSSFSYWLGYRYGPLILTRWPLRDAPGVVDSGRALMARWGAGAVPVSHFVGPLRPVVFVLAGLTRMGFPLFMAVNVAGAMAWAYVIPKFGEVGGLAIGWLWSHWPF